jgi:glycosyltransferase involved in cell wall biosynthesis
MNSRLSPLVTVITLCFNNGRFVIEGLESIRNQTYKNIQHIIIDDCSEDNSVELIDNWIKHNNYPCTFIKHEKNQRICKSMNEALRLSKGKYFCGVADDIWFPEKLEKQVELMENLPEDVGVVYSDAYLIDENGNLLPKMFIESYRLFSKMPEGYIFHILLQGNFIPSMAVLIRRACFEKVGYYDENLVYEDWDMWLRISRHYKFVFSPFVSAKYRIVSTSAVRTLDSKISESMALIRLKWFGIDKETDDILDRMITAKAEILYKMQHPKRKLYLYKKLIKEKKLSSAIVFASASLSIPYEIFYKFKLLYKCIKEIFSRIIKQ